MQRRVAAITDLFGSTLHGWWDDDALRLGASLAYYTLFAIAPILLVATAVLFTIGQLLIGLYLGQSTMTSTYGAAGSVMILLLWVYYSCQILLFGAEFTRAYAEQRGMTLQTAALASKDVTPLRRPR